jgi:hypothetical protein
MFRCPSASHRCVDLYRELVPTAETASLSVSTFGAMPATAAAQLPYVALICSSRQFASVTEAVVRSLRRLRRRRRASATRFSAGATNRAELPMGTRRSFTKGPARRCRTKVRGRSSVSPMLERVELSALEREDRRVRADGCAPASRRRKARHDHELEDVRVGDQASAGSSEVHPHKARATTCECALPACDQHASRPRTTHQAQRPQLRGHCQDLFRASRCRQRDGRRRLGHLANAIVRGTAPSRCGQPACRRAPRIGLIVSIQAGWSSVKVGLA